MARNPLIPRTPGQQAVDRLLNQTIPQLIQNQQRRQEREEDIARADRIRKEDLAIDQERYNDRIEQLENEIKEKQEELEYSTSETTIAILEEEIYNTKQSVEELKKYV